MGAAIALAAVFPAFLKSMVDKVGLLSECMCNNYASNGIVQGGRSQSVY